MGRHGERGLALSLCITKLRGSYEVNRHDTRLCLRAHVQSHSYALGVCGVLFFAQFEITVCLFGQSFDHPNFIFDI